MPGHPAAARENPPPKEPVLGDRFLHHWCGHAFVFNMN